MFEPLPDDLAAAIEEARLRLGDYADVRYQAEVESTNDVALALAAAGAREGTTVVADLQRAGRGRRGRDWFSPPAAGLYLSLVVRPPTAQGTLSIITLAAGAAAAEALGIVTSLPVELKWPNDLVIGRPWRKLGGILAETVISEGRIDAVVIGIGINVMRASYPPDIAHRATSIETELGRPVDRARLIVVLLERMRAIMARLHAGDDETVRRMWRQFARVGLAGAPVRWQDRGAVRRGLARDIDADGALLVESSGGIERIMAGEVTWEKLSRE